MVVAGRVAWVETEEEDEEAKATAVAVGALQGGPVGVVVVATAMAAAVNKEGAVAEEALAGATGARAGGESKVAVMEAAEDATEADKAGMVGRAGGTVAAREGEMEVGVRAGALVAALVGGQGAEETVEALGGTVAATAAEVARWVVLAQAEVSAVVAGSEAQRAPRSAAR